MNKIFSLEGKTALVTGASGGIGGAIANALYQAGADVVINGRDSKKLDNLKQKMVQERKYSAVFYYDIRATHAPKNNFLFGNTKSNTFYYKSNRVYPVAMSLMDMGAPEALVKRATELTGKNIDILVNSAGVHQLKSFTRITPEMSHYVMDVNYHIPFRLCQLVIEPMRKSGYGRIINVASAAAHGAAGQAHYNGSKGAVVALTKSLASNSNFVGVGNGITINAIAPGIIETEMAKNLRGKARQNNLNMIPMGRFGLPEEVAGAVVLFASPAGSYINAQILGIDGGMVR